MRLRTRPKYGNQKTDGSASKREAKALADLRLRERAGEISELKTQVEFELIPRQYVDGKLAEREIKYIADFTFMEDGRLVTADAKGYRTPMWVLKRKLMLFVHGIRVREM